MFGCAPCCSSGTAELVEKVDAGGVFIFLDSQRGQWPLGLVAKPTLTDTLLVTRLSPGGLVEKHNSSNIPSSEQLLLGDEIVSVNGVRTAESMVEALSKGSAWHLQVQQGERFPVMLERKAEDKLGLTLRTTTMGLLQIEAVRAGIVMEYNARSSGKGIHPGAYVVSVNNIRCDAQRMHEELIKVKNFVKLVVHLPSPDAGFMTPRAPATELPGTREF